MNIKTARKYSKPRDISPFSSSAKRYGRHFVRDTNIQINWSSTLDDNYQLDTLRGKSTCWIFKMSLRTMHLVGMRVVALECESTQQWKSHDYPKYVERHVGVVLVACSSTVSFLLPGLLLLSPDRIRRLLLSRSIPRRCSFSIQDSEESNIRFSSGSVR